MEYSIVFKPQLFSFSPSFCTAITVALFIVKLRVLPPILINSYLVNSCEVILVSLGEVPEVGSLKLKVQGLSVLTASLVGIILQDVKLFRGSSLLQ